MAMHSLRSPGNGSLLEKQEEHSGTIRDITRQNRKVFQLRVNSHSVSLVFSIFVDIVSSLLDQSHHLILRPYTVFWMVAITC